DQSLPGPIPTLPPYRDRSLQPVLLDMTAVLRDGLDVDVFTGHDALGQERAMEIQTDVSVTCRVTDKKRRRDLDALQRSPGAATGVGGPNRAGELASCCDDFRNLDRA